MTLYRAARDYSNGRFQLYAGHVVELDHETAAQVERDSPGTVEALAPEVVERLTAGLAELSESTGVTLTADWRPEPAKPSVARGGGPIMTPATMWGGR